MNDPMPLFISSLPPPRLAGLRTHSGFFTIRLFLWFFKIKSRFPMFQCQQCQQSSRQRFAVVTSGRSVRYTHVNPPHSKHDTTESQGWEIEQEVALCALCYAQHGHKPPVIHASAKHVKQLLQT
ncbi:MAG: hypothetical protein ACO1RX_18785 [Candidatus Sericytochromatia bacterium]